ncbi:IS1182 family transposase [Actinospica robiniae]|uniref:IS1182 family transposase n=1 Tax=Actinospica robiniae TaxID=304901 RepID=UPI0012FCDC6E|nr:IS1182 family transposase [Actinospica robiniae]
MQPAPWPEPDPQVAAAIKAIYRRKVLPLAVQVRDMLGEVFPDEGFVAGFGVRGRPGYSPGRLALVSVFQMAQKLTDRQAAEAAGRDLSWKYALGLGLDDPGFDHSVLPEFRSRVLEGGLEQHLLDVLLVALVERGLVKAGGKQRTDSTHVVSAVRDLNRLELAGESVRAAAEALVAAAPGWFASEFDVAGWSARYGRRIDSWRLPTSQTKRDQLTADYGQDGFALVNAVYAASAPVWLREIPAVGVLRRVLLQNYYVYEEETGKQVIRRRDAEKDGIPPAPSRIASPYDPEARWAAKGDDLFWCGYKVHLTETCDWPDEPAPGDASRRLDPPNIITNVATTNATVPDVAMTAQVHTMLADRGLTPAEHYLDSGYPSAALVLSSKAEHGIDLVTPLLADTSAQAKAGAGYDRSAFTFDFGARSATCPQGQSSSAWTPCVQNGTAKIVVTFPAAGCIRCPARDLCTRRKKGGRQVTVPQREVHELQLKARADQSTKAWQARYALRAGVEGTINQAIDLGIRRTRYRGIDKTRLHHVLTACAINLIRLDAYWNGQILDRTRTSHLGRLELSLIA